MLGGGGWDWFSIQLNNDTGMMVYQPTGNSYWEGAVSIHGQSAGQVVQSEGYVELTGYIQGYFSCRKNI
jgi:predicted secreted hydrolase